MILPNWDPKVLSVKGYQSEPSLYANDVTNSQVKSQGFNKPILGTLLPRKYQPPVSVFLDETCYGLVQNGLFQQNSATTCHAATLSVLKVTFNLILQFIPRPLK